MMRKGIGWVAGTVSLLWVSNSFAGIAECNDLRLEDALNCEIRGTIDCEASCEDLGIYKKACATKLVNRCKSVCTVDADAACTGGCTEICVQSCDRGENVICIHNCFDECSGSCEADCAEARDPEQCVATCEANCDAECDITCKPLVDGDCYKHCVECCGGTCTAHANMDCQQECQEEEFEDCEYELRADCQGSCSGDGALFCDGQFALAGEDIPTCLTALAEQTLADVQEALDELEGNAGASGSFSSRGSSSNGDDTVGGCSLQGAPSSPGRGVSTLALLGLGLLLRSRRRSPVRIRDSQSPPA